MPVISKLNKRYYKSKLAQKSHTWIFVLSIGVAETARANSETILSLSFCASNSETKRKKKQKETVEFLNEEKIIFKNTDALIVTAKTIPSPRSKYDCVQLKKPCERSAEHLTELQFDRISKAAIWWTRRPVN